MVLFGDDVRMIGQEGWKDIGHLRGCWKVLREVERVGDCDLDRGTDLRYGQNVHLMCYADSLSAGCCSRLVVLLLPRDILLAQQY